MLKGNPSVHNINEKERDHLKPKHKEELRRLGVDAGAVRRRR